MTQNPWRQRLYHLILWLVALAFFSPVLWIFLSAFKTVGEIVSPQPVFLLRPSMDNIVRVVTGPNVLEYLKMSFILSIGSVLIALLVLIAVSAKQGLDDIVEGANRWTWVALGLSAATLLVATLGLRPRDGGLALEITGRFCAVAAALLAIFHYGRRLDAQLWRSWLWESWRFGKQIFPRLSIGGVVVGVVRQLSRPEWIESLAGQNDLFANAVAVVFGVFMYFPSLVEVPVARMFLDLGMHPGPLLAYLMADPELSLQLSLIHISEPTRPY